MGGVTRESPDQSPRRRVDFCVDPHGTVFDQRTRTAVRILIAYGLVETLSESEINAIVRAVWDGPCAAALRVSAHHVPNHCWSSSEDLAFAWKALQLDLHYRRGEPDYWNHYESKAMRGHIADSGAHFYVEVYLSSAT